MSDAPAILGPDGMPLPKRPDTAEVAGPTLTGVRSVWTEPIASGLTPQRLAAVLRETAEPGGDARDYLTLAEEIEEREPHYRSVLGTRKLALRQIEPVIEAATDEKTDVEIADAVRRLVASPQFRACIFDLCDGIAKGYSVVEIMWRTTASEWTPFDYRWRDPRFFQFDRVSGAAIALRADGAPDGAALPPAKFIVHAPRLKSGIPIRGGLARVAMWAFMLKSFGLRDWMAFLDVYGIPWRIGKWHAGASEADKRALLRAVSQIAADGAAIVPEAMVIELLETKTSGGDAHEKICRYLDAQVSKLIIGQTMTADEGSSLSQAKIHDEVRRDLLRADADEMAATVQRDLIEPFVAFNFGAPKNGAPRFTMPVVEPEDLKAFMEVTGVFVDRGGRVSEAEVRDRLGLGDPSADEGLLRPVAGKPLRSAMNRMRLRGCPVCGGRPLPNPPPRAGEGVALLRDGRRDAIDVEAELDAVEAEALADWEPMMAPLVDPLLALARECASFDELIARLPELAGQLDSAELQRQLARATAIARGLGDATD